MLRKIRIVVAAVFFVGITLLFLDFTGFFHHWLGWMAKIQFLPALLALNLVVVIGLALITFIFGRLYCSVICPLGVFQDIVAWLGTRKKKNKYQPTKAKNILRYATLGIFALLMLLGLNSVAILIAPYSAYGRIAQNLFAPIYQAGNNVLAYFAERADSYAFYSTEVWMRSIPTFVIALITMIGIIILAWRGGRTWCNTICPVGTVLGFISRFSLFRPVIDRDKCIHCHACEKRCKASCIDIEANTLDMSRCVVCMNCIKNCKKGAVSYRFASPFARKTSEDKSVEANKDEAKLVEADQPAAEPTDESNAAPAAEREHVSTARRGFLMSLPALAISAVAHADDKTTDGGLAELKPRENPDRGEFSLKPAGARSYKNFATRCTGCQLCVANCPNGVLRPSNSLLSLMQPEMQFDKGFCRPECHRCSHVCPTGAIQPVSKAEKSSIQIGHAEWHFHSCLVTAEGIKCGNCARHCPNGAITLVEQDGPDGKKLEVPSVDIERCIGCGACEFVCPVRPVSAITVVGHE
ncbi:MAG: 4Fe-4S dicluster domain-containing protein, partial [Proteobacteria bacterium]|nr:4Fe-4S dicluster domain-containing protein [Pseudomonadota bacterium]